MKYGADGYRNYKKGICRVGYNDITYVYRTKHLIKPMKFIPSDPSIDLGDSTYSLVLALLFLNPNQKLGERAINKLKNLDNHSKIDLINNYGFNSNWREVLYLVNGYCIKK